MHADPAVRMGEVFSQTDLGETKPARFGITFVRRLDDFFLDKECLLGYLRDSWLRFPTNHSIQFSRVTHKPKAAKIPASRSWYVGATNLGGGLNLSFET